MEEIRGYLLKVVICGILCGISVALTANTGSMGKLVKLITGVCMLMTIVSPALQFRLGSVGSFYGKIALDADALVTEGEKISTTAMGDIIKKKTEAYILDKADSFGASLDVIVSLNNDPYPMPCAVRISGSISPYGKRQMQSIIRDDLGIALEDQIWIG